MSDKELIEIIAKMWIEGGGDSEGFMWNITEIYNKLKEMEIKNDKDEYDREYD